MLRYFIFLYQVSRIWYVSDMNRTSLLTCHISNAPWPNVVMWGQYRVSHF